MKVHRSHDTVPTGSSKWISFTLNERGKWRVTDMWEVWGLGDANHLGQVRWLARWRKYCFFPSSGSAFEGDCLRDLAKFLEDETEKHRKGKRSFA